MHIIILGGGAAGMISAHYLAKKHRVTVIERESILGGNIRTLNGNVATENLPPGLFVDNGVIEFHRDSSPALHSVIHELGLQLAPVSGGSTALYLDNQRSLHMPGAIREQTASRAAKLKRYLQLGLTLRHMIPIGMRTLAYGRDSDKGIGQLLGQDSLSNWIRMLLMYGYSIPFKQIDDFPARLAIPTLRQGAIGTRWARLPGGVYSYIQRIIDLAGSNLTIITGQAASAISRSNNGVEVQCGDLALQADKIVIATPPAQVLQSLRDPNPHEASVFANWHENTATTVIHTDTDLYNAWGKPGYTEFDVFAKAGGNDAGYNAYLNRLCGLPEDHHTHYFLAYNLADRINPAKILHTQHHCTPLYTSDAYCSIDAIKAHNGSNNTYFAGAYLYNGLHEGAAQSALSIRDLLLN